MGVSSKRWSNEDAPAPPHPPTAAGRGGCWAARHLLERRLPAWQGRSGSIGRSDGWHLGREPVVGLGEDSIHSNGRCCPPGAQTPTRQPPAWGDSQIQTLPAPGG